MGLRKIFLLALLCVSFFVKAQVLQQPNTYGIGWKRTGADTLLYIPSDTLNVPAWGVGKTHIARKGTSLYYWNGTAWTAITGAAGYTTGAVDSVWRIAGKDSIFWLKNGTTYKFKDSTGGNTGAAVYYLSQQGCVSDADLSMFPSTLGTNNTTAIQAVLDNAVSGPIRIYWDGAYSFDSIRIRSNTEIIVTNPEFGGVQRSGIAASAVANYNRTTGEIQDSNIIINGGTWNGYGTLPNGQPNKNVNGYGGLVTIFNFRGIKNSQVINATIINSRTFIGYTQNFSDFKLLNCSLIQPNNYTSGPDISYTLTHDGWKFGGPGKYVVVNNVFIKAYDDALSICANDSFDPAGTCTSAYGFNTSDIFGNYGDITDVVFSNIYLDTALHGIRILTKDNSVDRILIDGVYGVVGTYAIVIDDLVGGCVYPSTGTPDNGSITLNNFDLKVTGDDGPLAYYSTAFNINVPIKKLSLTNWRLINDTVGRNIIRMTSGASITEFYAQNFTVDGVTDPKTLFSIVGGGVIDSSGNLFGDNTLDEVLTAGNTSTRTASVGGLTITRGIGSQRDNQLINNSGVDNFATLQLRPPTGTNVASALSLIPRGSGYVSALKTQLDIFNTDFVADGTNYEQLLIRAAGTDGYGFGSIKGGSGTLRPIWFDATGTFSQATSNLFLNTNGKTGIGTITPDSTLHILGGFKLVNGTQGANKVLTSDANGGASWQNVTISRIDTITLASFGYGARLAGDTAAATDSSLYGSFYHDGSDTLIITGLRAVITSGDTLGVQVYYNDTINVIGSAVATSTLAVNSSTTGNSTTTFSNNKIPPGNWVWCKSPTVVAGRKPEYLSVSLIGYRKTRQ